MGKGDRRTRRGKLWVGSHGKTRSASKEKARAAKGSKTTTVKKTADV